MRRYALPLLVISLTASSSSCFWRARPSPRPVATLAFDVRDAATGALMPCKLTLVGIGGWQDPRLDGPAGRRVGDAVVAGNRILSASGAGEVQVPVGVYDVYVSHGLEWDLAVLRRVEITRRGATVHTSLRRAVATPGWISADFHVHAEPSHDSPVPMDHRVIEFLASGVELIVATDHNTVTDYRPTIAELGYDERVAAVPGNEITTKWGHWGAFPLPDEMIGERFGGGSMLPLSRAGSIITDLREMAPDAVVNLHHPRRGLVEGGYFDSMNYDARRDWARRANMYGAFYADFDALEVLNGSDVHRWHLVEQVIEDWFGLLDHGHMVTATGNSDTHTLTDILAGYPRNYVRVDRDDPGAITGADLARAIRERRVFFTTGPIVRKRVGEADIGDVAPAPGGYAIVEIEVDAAPWIDVKRVILYVNGEEEQSWKVPPSKSAGRLEVRHEVMVERDSHVVVMVFGDDPLWPIAGDLRTTRISPFAMTNPIFLDVDGNGRFDPPFPHGPH